MGQRLNVIRKRNVGLSNTKTIIRKEIKKANLKPTASVTNSVATPLNYTQVGGSDGNEDQTSDQFLSVAGDPGQLQINGNGDLDAADASYDSNTGTIRAKYASYDGQIGKTIDIVGPTVTQHIVNGVTVSVTLNLDGSEVTSPSTPA